MAAALPPDAQYGSLPSSKAVDEEPRTIPVYVFVGKEMVVPLQNLLCSDPSTHLNGIRDAYLAKKDHLQTQDNEEKNLLLLIDPRSSPEWTTAGDAAD